MWGVYQAKYFEPCHEWDIMPSKYLSQRVENLPKKFYRAFKKLRRLSPEVRREAIMKHANVAFICAMCDFVKKLRRLQLSIHHEGQMRKQKKTLRKFIDPDISTERKRKLLAQRGGLLSLLLSWSETLSSMLWLWLILSVVALSNPLDYYILL